MYFKSFLLKEKISNNAFDYEERQKFNPLPHLYVPSLRLGTVNDLKIGREIVFEALNDEGKLQSCVGLEHFLQIPLNSGQNIYIFDNHNHAFSFWHKERNEQNIDDNCTLIHIDQHKDTRIPISFLIPEESKNLEKVYEYTNTILNVGNFIPPAIKTGLIKNIIFIDSESSLQEFSTNFLQKNKSQNILKNFILDIDIDFFAPELDYIDNKKKLDVIQELLPMAKVITIATSPFFINQELALNWIKKILPF